MPTIRTIDETAAGAKVEGPSLQLDRDEMTVRDLIALRVREEVRRYNRDRPEKYYGLVQPTDVETMLNGPAARRFQLVDADHQVQVALKAFRDQRFIVLLPDGQAESLEDRAQFFEGDQVSFLRLVPLVGG
ncbi:hypothetical protein [Fimbriimonas ginsengisoli]|uniref:Uncharacterized protein n=1 Tax=Fimbriimonas ginsengisoli Gsoil 348 TaxID=661478 RepID=A0A068NRY4_FIMGI|nr:hypothetical protein [Fimbriimonas ginsengisoli]AIE86318.1 hypothetical protein OP10G_2950 [Fimbriimonas ginsengisoli Gsoil 348]